MLDRALAYFQCRRVNLPTHASLRGSGAFRRVLQAVALCAVCIDPAHAQPAVVVFGSGGAGASTTSEGTALGSALGPGVGGSAATVVAAGGVWLSSVFGLAADLSVGMPFQVEQVEGGVGRCCSALTRDHSLTFLAAVVKVRVIPRFVLITGPSFARIGTKETRIYRPIGGTPQAPVVSESSLSDAAWVFGAEAEIPLSRRWQLVPAARVYRNLSTEYDEFAGTLALGNTTARLTLSLLVTSGR